VKGKQILWAGWIQPPHPSFGGSSRNIFLPLSHMWEPSEISSRVFVPIPQTDDRTGPESDWVSHSFSDWGGAGPIAAALAMSDSMTRIDPAMSCLLTQTRTAAKTRITENWMSATEGKARLESGKYKRLLASPNSHRCTVSPYRRRANVKIFVIR
jgi:hypothetical protein